MEAEDRWGWIMLVRDTPTSNWGGIEDFYEELEESLDASGLGSIEFKVRGRTAGSKAKISPGDGIAFYHSKKSRFPLPDTLGGRQRVSLVGDIVDVKQQGETVEWLSVRFRADVFRALRRGPIPRDESTEFIFSDSGMERGGAGSFFASPPATWTKMEERSSHTKISEEEAAASQKVAIEAESEEGSEGLRAGEAEDATVPVEELEGTALELLASTRAQSEILREKKIKKVREQQSGRLGCEVCRFDFETSFGQLAKNYIHIHHLQDLDTRQSKGKKTKLSDLAALCANCHAMAHQNSGAPLALQELRKLTMQKPHPRPR